MKADGGGTGQKLTHATTIVAGVASLTATIVSVVSIYLQAKNYRKPLLQRYVIRILLMVPIYSIASFTSMISLTASAFVDPIRDIYEAFTIYTFFQLLINYLDGERALIIMTHGRAPINHLWPLDHVLEKVDISDPHTFLSIKRGILQYAWLKPILALSAIIMKATGAYKEGYLSVDSGYFWSGIIYNISVSVSLYSLGLFWVCTHHDLTPFRPVPKFLCIKLIIFASYWQGFFLSILVWVGAIPDDVKGYTPDNLAAAIQDALICVEMPIFAVAHWYAFSVRDFADNSILSARMPLLYALRDSFGIRDLIEDSKQTFKGDNYGYRIFDSGDKVMAHEDSRSRLARLKDGMRYERGGKGKYWLPKPGEVNSRTPLLRDNGSPGSSRADQINENINGTFDEPELDPEEDQMYDSARELEYGDWNYPVITASEPLLERYMAGRLNTDSPAYSPSHLRPPNSASAAFASSHSKRQPEPQQVKPLKKKKTKRPAEVRQAERHEDTPAAAPKAQDDAVNADIPVHEATTSVQTPEDSKPLLQNNELEHEEDENDGPSDQHTNEAEEFQNPWGNDSR